MVSVLKNDRKPAIIATIGKTDPWRQQQQIHRHRPSHDNDECDPYHILHIRRDATKYEMKRSYQQLSLLYHPSLTISTSQQHQQSYEQKLFLFSLIAASYETLSIKETRQRMDMILQQQQKQQNQGLVQHRSTTANITMQKSEKHKAATPTKDGKETKNSIVMSKEERKIRKKLQRERRVQQQQRRENMKKKKNTKNNNKQEQQPQSTTTPMRVSPSSSTASSYNYHHHHRSHRVNDRIVDTTHDDGSGIDDNRSRKCPTTETIATTTTHHAHGGNNIQQKRNNKKKRGYNWAYVSSSCGCPNTDDDHDDHVIPYDEPFDRIDQTVSSPTTAAPHVVDVMQRTTTDTNHQHKIKSTPPSLVESSDSALNEDDSDSDFPLASFQIITRDISNNNQPSTTTANDTERWFGGPLKLMHRARKFQPFTDPFVLFERSFRSGMITTTQQHPTTTQSSVYNNSSTNNIVGLLRLNKIPPSTLATFSSCHNAVPISAVDDTLEALQDGTIITRTHRRTNLPAVTRENQTIQRTISRTITRHPPDPTNNHRQMTVSVTSDCNNIQNDRADTAHVLLSTTRSFYATNHCVDCISWMTCNSSSDEKYFETTLDGDKNQFSWWKWWFPAC